MIPAAWLFLRTYGRFVVFPVAMVVGFVGYQLESRFGSGAKKLPYMETSVKEERMRRHLDDKPDSFQTLHDRKFVPKSSLETNPVSS